MGSSPIRVAIFYLVGSTMVKKSAQADSKTEQTPNPISRLAQYIEDSRGELRKVTWPTLKETRKATFAVLGFVAVMAVVLGLVDLGLSAIIKSILS